MNRNTGNKTSQIGATVFANIVQGGKISVTDDQIRACFNRNLTMRQAANELGVAFSTISRRAKKLSLATSAAVLQPREAQRFTHQQIDALGNLNKSLDKVHLLMDACDEWLRDADDPTKYDVGPRAKEVDVTYIVEIPTDKGYRYEKRKKSLDKLLATLEADDDGLRISKVERSEYKHADPRELILRTSQEVRSTIDLAADLARLLVDYRAMQQFREAVIATIHDCDPEAARKVAEAVRRTVVLHAALGGLDHMAP